jgi:hypothetical protein
MESGASESFETATEAAVVALSCGRGLVGRALFLEARPNRAVRASGEFLSFGLTPSACTRIFMLLTSTTEVPGRADLSPASGLLLSAATSPLLVVMVEGLSFRGVFPDGAVEKRRRACMPREAVG